MKAYRVTLEIELQDTIPQMLELIEFKLHELGQVECWIVSDVSRERQVACVDEIVLMSSQPNHTNHNLAYLASNDDRTSTHGKDAVDDEDDAPTDPNNRDSVS